MKNTTFALAAAAAMFALSGQAFAEECTAASLKGHYTYWLQGVDASGKATAEVGQEIYDGAGNLTSISAASGSAETETDTGTYTVNGDCSGTVTYASGASYHLFVAPSGDSFVFSSSQEGVVQAGENTRVDTH